MTFFQKIKAAFAVKKFVNTTITEAKRMDKSKPGYKTTEFYFQMAAQVAILWGAVSKFIPPEQAAMISAVGIAVYTIARTIDKAINKIQEAKAGQSTVVTTEPVTTITTPKEN